MSSVKAGQFPPEWYLLQQECFLAQKLLYSGLTELSRGSISMKGSFYAGFHGITIGLERLLKLTFIVDHMECNNLTCPGKESMRRFSHNLVKLLDEIAEISKRRGIVWTQLSVLQKELISFFSAFAKDLRYHNLDTLAGGGVAKDPLIWWDEILVTVYERTVPLRRRHVDSHVASNLDRDLKGATTTLLHDLSKQPASLGQSYRTDVVIAKATPVVVLNIVQIVKSILGVLLHVASLTNIQSVRQRPGVPIVPEVAEFFRMLDNPDTYLKSRRVWS